MNTKNPAHPESAARQDAVEWQTRWQHHDGTWEPWHTISNHSYRSILAGIEQNTWAMKYEARALYAAPVAAPQQTGEE